MIYTRMQGISPFSCLMSDGVTLDRPLEPEVGSGESDGSKTATVKKLGILSELV